MNSGRKLLAERAQHPCSWIRASVPLGLEAHPLAGVRSGPRRRCYVMMITVFLQSTVRPLASVSRPSSIIGSRMLKTSGWAFSISSKRRTA